MRTVRITGGELVDRGLLTVDELGLAGPATAPVVALEPRAGWT